MESSKAQLHLKRKSTKFIERKKAHFSPLFFFQANGEYGNKTENELTKTNDFNTFTH